MGDTLHRHPGVADVGQLTKGGIENGFADLGIAWPSRRVRNVDGDPSLPHGRLAIDRPFRGRPHTWATAGAAPGAPLGTKSCWRTRAKAATAPMKATTALMIIRWLRVLEKPVR